MSRRLSAGGAGDLQETFRLLSITSSATRYTSFRHSEWHQANRRAPCFDSSGFTAGLFPRDCEHPECPRRVRLFVILDRRDRTRKSSEPPRFGRVRIPYLGLTEEPVSSL